jgi:rod shape-determining protein MreC
LRDSPFSDVKVPLAWTAALALVVLLVAAIALLVSDRRETFEQQAYGAAKQGMDTVATPISGALSAPVRWTESGISGVRGYFFAISENRRLHAENIELQRWRDAALALKNENDRLRAVLSLKTDPPVPMVTGHAVSDSRGPFSNSRLINVGREMGVQIGNPVMSENGLVGRIVGVTDGASRVLLVTDIASKVPVMINRTNARAILTGDGGPNPKLMYMRGVNPIKAGDLLVTSGDGGVFPRGLPVGVAMKGLDGTWRVQLSSDYAPIDFVRVLKFQDFTKLVNLKELTQSQLPPAPPGLNAPVPTPLATPSPSATNAPVTAKATNTAAAATSKPANSPPKAINAPARKAANAPSKATNTPARTATKATNAAAKAANAAAPKSISALIKSANAPAPKRVAAPPTDPQKATP